MIRKVVIIALSLILVAILLFTGMKERTVLILEEQKSGEKHVFYPADGLFELGYTHSVLLTPVDEFFSINAQNDLILQKTIYESFGVGLPYEQLEDTDFEIIEGKFILYLNRTFETINMVISPIPKHTITVNGETSYITELFSEDTIIVGSEAFEKIISSDEGRLNNTHIIKIYAIRKKVFLIGNFQVVL
ncbi:MAG TPA: hypothetical protein DCS67_10250 [Clostridiales bacterium UBA8960]|nr:hypothetical protein [Clostridiales bacterium UBA8960]